MVTMLIRATANLPRIPEKIGIKDQPDTTRDFLTRACLFRVSVNDEILISRARSFFKTRIKVTSRGRTGVVSSRQRLRKQRYNIESTNCT